MNDKTGSGIEAGRDVPRMRTLLDTNWFWQRIRSVKRRLVTARTAHTGVDRQSRIKKQRPPEFDPISRYRKLRSRHIFGQWLKDPLRLLQQHGVVRRDHHKENREGRRYASGVQAKLGHLGPPNIDPRPARGSQIRRLNKRCLRQFYATSEWPLDIRLHSRSRPPRAAPARSIHIGLSRVTSISAARAITVPLAITSPITTGTSPRRTICCHDALRNLSHSRYEAK